MFPGQGAQKVGMGRSVYEASPEARAVFEAADAALGEPLSTCCFEGPADALALTANTQPAVLTTSVALLRALGERPDVAAGHSLGEYSAHVCAGTFSFEDAVRTVRARGRYMQEAVPVGQGAMAAVMKLEREVVEEICRRAEGTVEAVNYNCPGQVVIAGAADAVASASAAVRSAGGRAIPLPVSAPFHSSLMRPAEGRLAVDLKRLDMRDPAFPVVANVSAEPLATAAGAREASIRQVSRPVRWEQSVRRMIDDGVGLFVEVGPGRALCAMIARISKEVRRINVEGPDDFAAAREAISAAR